MTFDDVLVKHVGDFGFYQKSQLLLVCLPILFLSMHSLSWTFTGALIDSRCLLSNEKPSDGAPFYPKNNTNYVKWLKTHETNFCQRPVNFSIDEIFTENHALNAEKCVDGYKWDTSQIKRSAIMRWNFVCDKEWLRAFIQSFYYLGMFFGSFVCGILADSWGRRPVFFIAIVAEICCGIVTAFVPYWQLFTFLRFMLGFFHPAIHLTAVVMAVEMLGPSKRILSGIVPTFFYDFGQITLAGLAYTFRYYEDLQLAISAPVAIFLIYWWLVPESARWLVNRDRLEEAEKILKKVARWNKRHLPENWLLSELQSQENAAKETAKRTTTFWDLFKNHHIRKNIFALFFCWTTASLTYYGIAMNPGFMGGQRYLPFVIGGILDCSMLIALLFCVNFLGRKFMAVMGFSLAAVCLFISVLVYADFPNVRMLCVALAKMCIAAVFAVLLLYTPELFPTAVRMSAVGTCSMVARVGGILASYVFLYLAKFYPATVAISLCVSCILAAVAVLILPETSGYPQVETIDDVEALAKKSGAAH